MSSSPLRLTTQLWIFSFLGGALNFSSQVLLAYSLTKEDFGTITFAIGVATIFASLGGFGAGSYWLKIFGNVSYRALRWVPGTIAYCGITSLIAVSTYLIVVGSASFSGSMLTTCMFLIVLIPTQGLLDLASAKLQLEGRLISLATLQLLPWLLRFLAILIATKIFGVVSALNVAALVAVASTIVLFICTGHLRDMLKSSFQLEGHFGSRDTFERPLHSCIAIFDVFRGTWPFGLINFLHLTHSSSSIVLTFYLLGSEDVAVFSVALLFILASYTFPSVLFTKVLAASMHRRIHFDKDRLVSDYHLIAKNMLCAGVAVAIIIYIFCPFVVNFIFGPAYSESGALVRILTISIPFHFLSVAFDVLLTTGSAIFIKLKIMFFLIGLNISFGLLGSLFFGLMGIAISFTFVQAVASLLYFLAYRSTFTQPSLAK